jgi:hypothetical protein
MRSIKIALVGKASGNGVKLPGTSTTRRQKEDSTGYCDICRCGLRGKGQMNSAEAVLCTRCQTKYMDIKPYRDEPEEQK